MIRLLKQQVAKRKLQRIVEANRKAPATIDYRRRREASLKATPATA